MGYGHSDSLRGPICRQNACQVRFKNLGFVETREISGRVRLTHELFDQITMKRLESAICHSQKTEFNTALKSNIDNYLDTENDGLEYVFPALKQIWVGNLVRWHVHLCLT